MKPQLTQAALGARFQRGGTAFSSSAAAFSSSAFDARRAFRGSDEPSRNYLARVAHHFRGQHRDAHVLGKHLRRNGCAVEGRSQKRRDVWKHKRVASQERMHLFGPLYLSCTKKQISSVYRWWKGPYSTTSWNTPLLTTTKALAEPWWIKLRAVETLYACTVYTLLFLSIIREKLRYYGCQINATKEAALLLFECVH